MTSPTQLLNFFRAALLVAIAMYVFIGENLGGSPSTVPNSMLLTGAALVAVLVIVAIFVFRRTIVLPAARALAGQEYNGPLLTKWRNGYMVTYALCEAVALFGFTLRILGFGLRQVAPFYLAAILLMLYFGPRLPASEQS